MKPQKGVKNAQFIATDKPNPVFPENQQAAGCTPATTPSAAASTTADSTEDPLTP